MTINLYQGSKKVKYEIQSMSMHTEARRRRCVVLIATLYEMSSYQHELKRIK